MDEIIELTTAPEQYTARPMSLSRAEIEARRGIIRDKEGKIIRSDEWKLQRKNILVKKYIDYATRMKNIEEELTGYGFKAPTRKEELGWWKRFWNLILELF